MEAYLQSLKPGMTQSRASMPLPRFNQNLPTQSDEAPSVAHVLGSTAAEDLDNL